MCGGNSILPARGAPPSRHMVCAAAIAPAMRGTGRRADGQQGRCPDGCRLPRDCARRLIPLPWRGMGRNIDRRMAAGRRLVGLFGGGAGRGDGARAAAVRLVRIFYAAGMFCAAAQRADGRGLRSLPEDGMKQTNRLLPYGRGVRFGGGAACGRTAPNACARRLPPPRLTPGARAPAGMAAGAAVHALNRVRTRPGRAGRDCDEIRTHLAAAGRARRAGGERHDEEHIRRRNGRARRAGGNAMKSVHAWLPQGAPGAREEGTPC